MSSRRFYRSSGDQESLFQKESPDLLIFCSRLAVSLVAVCSISTVTSGSANQTANSAAPGTIYEGARLIVGDGSAPIENSAFIVGNDHFTRIGRRGQLLAPTGGQRVDLTGKTVMPALVDAHVHLGYRKNLSFTADNYTRENLLDTLDRFAYCGIAAVLEAGTGRGDLPFDVRT